jgi:outer membrane protein OmpA-like peptidoglycan-associated protein/Tol biopolymer transport system component
MKKISLLSLLLLACFTMLAQYDPSKVNKQARQHYDQAMERVEDGNLPSAAGLLLKAVDLDKNFVEAYLALGGIYGRLKSYNSSIQNFEKAFALDTVYTMDYRVQYSIQLASAGEFQKALDAINVQLTRKPPKNPTSLESAQNRKRSYEFAIEYAKQNGGIEYVFAPQNIGPGINTEESEYFPSLSIDGKELVFTRRIRDINEDFYYSYLNDGKWDLAKPISSINTPQNEAGQQLSHDGQWLLFTANNRPDGFGNFDLYISFLEANGWSAPENLGPKINSEWWESQPSLSPDKKDLYFASRRYGGYGGIDIYVSHLQPNGTWTEPENLGAGINTAGDDQCPLIHADNQTLYFVSTGWLGYGGNDLFMVRKNSNGTWTKPMNLGYPINTIHDEGTLFITADGLTAYYASDRSDSKGGNDIYSFDLPEKVRPIRTLWVKGTVTDDKTRKGLQSTLELIDLGSKQRINLVHTDLSGNYLVTLPIGKDYAFNVNRKGYLFYSDQFLLASKAPDSTYVKNISLSPIEVNGRIILKNVFFDVGKFDLKPESQIELDKLVLLLQENPGVRIEIGGHTDNVGKPSDNLSLSINRAKAVVNYLVARNIPATRLVAKGYGETKAVADNNTEEGRAQNRRTEMIVTGLNN